MAAGFTLGFWRGLAAVYPAAVLGAVLSFAAGRRLGTRWRAYIPTKVATLWVKVRSPPRNVRPYVYALFFGQGGDPLRGYW